MVHIRHSCLITVWWVDRLFGLMVDGQRPELYLIRGNPKSTERNHPPCKNTLLMTENSQEWIESVSWVFHSVKYYKDIPDKLFNLQRESFDHGKSSISESVTYVLYKWMFLRNVWRSKICVVNTVTIQTYESRVFVFIPFLSLKS